MISGDSTERSEFEHKGTHGFASLNGKTPISIPNRMIGRSWSFTSFLRTVINWRKRDRYFDTGESGETYDAEMEAVAAEPSIR